MTVAPFIFSVIGQSPFTNVALHKPTWQSSTRTLNGVALSSDRAVDGNFSTNVVEACSSANGNKAAWLAVDLGTMVHVHWIQLTNPTGTDGKGDAKRINKPTSLVYVPSTDRGLCSSDT
jgi:hypothetical protein